MSCIDMTLVRLWRHYCTLSLELMEIVKKNLNRFIACLGTLLKAWHYLHVAMAMAFLRCWDGWIPLLDAHVVYHTARIYNTSLEASLRGAIS